MIILFTEPFFLHDITESVLKIWRHGDEPERFALSHIDYVRLLKSSINGRCRVPPQNRLKVEGGTCARGEQVGN